MQQRPSPRERRRNLLSACAAAAAILAAVILAEAASFPGLSPWYRDLLKPAFTPPSWLFAPVWTLLYGLMGVALWRLLRMPEESAARRRALTAFFAQLAFNVAWPWLFFDLHSPGLALFDIYPQLLCIVLAIRACFAVDATAASCLAPLLLWVAYASALNLSIWHLNG
jgi:translocator protein